MANVKPGVTRLREELEAAAGRPVALVTGEATTGEPLGADVVVGTEAVLHRAGGRDVVAFLDIDSELLAPRYRAHEHVMALVVRAGRLVGRNGLVLVQTHQPDHEVVHALRGGELAPVIVADLERRRALRLPPFGALAAVEGPGAAALVATIGLPSAQTSRGFIVRADAWSTLGSTLAAAPRERGSVVRVAVDPPRV